MRCHHIPLRDFTRLIQPPFSRRAGCKDFTFSPRSRLCGALIPTGLHASHVCTQCDLVATVMFATFTQQQLVVSLFCRNQHSMLITPLTEWMLCRILVMDSFPCTSITLLCILIPTILFIIAVYLHRMLFTVPSICTIWTTRISTRFLRSAWQKYHLQTQQKTPRKSIEFRDGFHISFQFLYSIQILWCIIFIRISIRNNSSPGSHRYLK